MTIFLLTATLGNIIRVGVELEGEFSVFYSSHCWPLSLLAGFVLCISVVLSSCVVSASSHMY